jgi:flagellar motor protein MotB
MVARKLVKMAMCVAGLFVFASFVGGCNCGTDLQKENDSLRAQLQTCQTDKQSLTQQNQLLTQQNQALQADNGQLRDQLAKGSSRLTGHPLSENTGAKEKFGPGLDVSENARAVTVTLPEAILFDSGKAVLKESSKSTLKKIAEVVKKHYAGKEIRVEGHTDNDPIKKSHFVDNWELSTERALAVVRDLTKAGDVEAKHICAVGFGEFAPKGPDKAKNRRVEIVILK